MISGLAPPIRLPLHVEMADVAERDQVADVVGLSVTRKSERLEGLQVVDVQRLAGLFWCFSAPLANLVPSTDRAHRRSPRWAVVRIVSTAVIRVSWPNVVSRLPCSLTGIRTESATGGLRRFHAEGSAADRALYVNGLLAVPRRASGLPEAGIGFAPVILREPTPEARLRAETAGLARDCLKRSTAHFTRGRVARAGGSACVRDQCLTLANVRAVFPRPASVVRERATASWASGRDFLRRIGSHGHFRLNCTRLLGYAA